MIGNRIREIRKDRDLTLSELARRAGITKSYLSSIERNIQVNPTLEILHKLSIGLGVSIDVLIFPDEFINKEENKLK